MEEQGGIPWVFIHLGWIILGLALAYGILRSRRRLNRSEKSAQQQQVHENFRRDEDAA